jgi:uncharacterized protein
MEVILTDQCNLRCDYCFEAGKNPHGMNEDTARAAVDFLMKISGPTQHLTILFFGGEPLLRFDLLQAIVAYANESAARHSKLVHYDMTTNGTLMTQDKLEYLRSRSITFLLSMDGIGEDHDRYRHYAEGRGSYDIVAEKIPLMKRYQPWMGVKMTVTPQSCTRLRDNIAQLHRMGINQFVLGYAHGIKWTTDDLVAYEEAMLEVCELYLEMKYRRKYFRMTLFEEGEPGSSHKKESFGCGAGRGRFCVDSYGDVYGCSKLATITGMRNGVLPYGNVFQGLVQPENRSQFMISDVGPRAKCKSCEFRGVCGGGCPAVNYAATGSIHDPDDLSCRIVFVNQRIHAYMRIRHKEVFGEDRIGRITDESLMAAKADAVCTDE